MLTVTYANQEIECKRASIEKHNDVLTVRLLSDTHTPLPKQGALRIRDDEHIFLTEAVFLITRKTDIINKKDKVKMRTTLVFADYLPES